MMIRTVRGNILGINPLPKISEAYSLVLLEEKQREITATSPLNIDSSAKFSQQRRQGKYPSYNGNNMNVPKTGYNGSGNNNNNNNNNADRRVRFFCTYCKTAGHTFERCFKLHPELRNNNNNNRRMGNLVLGTEDIKSDIQGHTDEENNPPVQPSLSVTPELCQQLMELLTKHNVEVNAVPPPDVSSMMADDEF